MTACRFAAALLPLVFLTALAAGLATPARAGVGVNQPAPPLDTRLINGRILKAKELQGKVVVTLFWASWCPSCRSALPELQRLYGELQPQGLEIIALSIDENPKDVREFLRGKGLAYPVGMRGDAWFEHYGRVSVTPTVYVNDRDGVVRHRLAGGVTPAKIETLVRPLLERQVSVEAKLQPAPRPARSQRQP